MTYRNDFRAVGYPLRLYSGKDALENLPAELKRHRAKRAFIVCGRTVSRKTPLVSRIRGILGESLAGVFDEMAKESPLSAVLAARDAARAAQADLLIGDRRRQRDTGDARGRDPARRDAAGRRADHAVSRDRARRSAPSCSRPSSRSSTC